MTNPRGQGRFTTRPLVGEWTPLLVEEQFRKSVALICADVPVADGSVTRQPRATAFFVAARLTPERAILYVVTAHHVITRARELRFPLHLRVNLKDHIEVEPGKPRYVDLPLPDTGWFLHPEADVAVMQFGFQRSELDVIAIAVDACVRGTVVAGRTIGPGDEIFFSGLFSQVPGQTKALPIVRFGNIAMMPDEPVRLNFLGGGTASLVRAYLVEARSWGGHSGAPAFVYFPIGRQSNSIQLTGSMPPWALLGIVSGHYPSQGVFGTDALDNASATPNAGIAVVTPASAIIEVFMSGEAVADREKLKQALEEQRDPEADAVMDFDDGGAHPDSEERLSLDPLNVEDALRAMLRTPRED